MKDTWAKVVICIFLMIATFCIYSQVQDHDFIILDDYTYIAESSLVQAGLTNESILRAFTTQHLGGWLPIASLSHMLDYELYGSNPKGHLLTNLFFHISNSLLLFLVLLRMTGAIWQSAFVATMFALHPLNVESVAWVVERRNVLGAFFWLMTMWAYIHYAEQPTVKRYGLVFLFFTLGLMSKPTLVTLPFVLLLLDYWPLRRLKFGQERGSNKILEKNTAKRSEVFRLVLEKTPLFLLTTGSSIITFIDEKSLGAMNYAENLTFSTRVANAMVSYLEYLGKMAWPSGLSIFYPHPGNSLTLWKGLLCGMALVGITIISIRLVRKAPHFAVGWFWYLGTLVPVIGIVQVGGQAMADRYTYVPLIGIFITVAWGIPELISKWRYKEKVLSILVGIIISTLLITTWVQVSHWKNSTTVFKHAIRVTDKKYPIFTIIHNNLGIALSADGKNEEAISHFKVAIKLNPTHTKAYNNLGLALFAERRNEEAITHYKMAIKLEPDYAPAYNNLGNALSAELKIEEAIYHYEMAIKLNPDSAKAHYNLGNVLFNAKMTEEAIDYYKKAIRIRPNFAVAHNNLGNALAQKGEMKEAIDHYRETLKLKPDLVAAQKNLETALLLSQELE